MSYYRKNFPTASITAKLHLLEDHKVPFFGLLGEQGAESIHKDFNAIKDRFVNIATPRLWCRLQEHHLQCSQSLREAKPQPKQRRVAEK